MSRVKGHTAGGAAEQVSGRHMPPLGRDAGCGRRGAGRRAGAAAVAALAALIGSGAHAADAEAFSSGPEAREVQIAAISRQEGRILVDNEPLLRVIDELNRHSERKVKVDRSDPRYRRLRVTGQFRTGRAGVIVQYMRAAGLKVQVRRDEDGNLLLLLKPGPTQG